MEWLENVLTEIMWLIILLFIVSVVLLICILTCVVTYKCINSILRQDPDEEEDGSENNQMQAQQEANRDSDGNVLYEYHHQGIQFKNCDVDIPAENNNHSNSPKSANVSLEQRYTVKIRITRHTDQKRICWRLVLQLSFAIVTSICMMLFIARFYGISFRGFFRAPHSVIHLSSNGTSNNTWNPMVNFTESHSKQNEEKASSAEFSGKESKKVNLFSTMLDELHLSVKKCQSDEIISEINDHNNAFPSPNMKVEYLEQKQTSSEDINCENCEYIQVVDDNWLTTEEKDKYEAVTMKVRNVAKDEF